MSSPMPRFAPVWKSSTCQPLACRASSELPVQKLALFPGMNNCSDREGHDGDGPRERRTPAQPATERPSSTRAWLHAQRGLVGGEDLRRIGAQKRYPQQQSGPQARYRELVESPERI